ncbi:MAG: DNA polymerase III subunit delta [Bryobacteraceae bacterium]
MKGSASAAAGISPEQFLRHLERGAPPVCLFAGAEAYQRERCRRALIEAALAPEERKEGLIRHDLDEVGLTEVVDDARALSLFASRRVIWVSSAEAALPRGRAIAEQDEETGEEKPGGAAALAGYIRDPTPGTVLVLECSRWEFEGEEKAKLERLQKFYAAVPVQVEFRPYSLEASRALAREVAREKGLNIGVSELGLLVEALGGDTGRIAAEVEKLSLYAQKRKVTADDIVSLVPNARAGTVFALVAALGRGDRARSLDILDSLVRDGEYLPLALTFLATQFRLALAAREAGLRTSQQVLAHFSKLGMRIWPDRANQIQQTVAAFPQDKLENALQRVFRADRALREPRPDDRVVLEELILSLT